MMKFSHSILIRFILLALLFQFSSCAVFNQMEKSMDEQAGRKADEETPLTIRRKIKDVDYRTMGDDSSLKKRIVILPFVDKDPAKRTDEVRIHSREAFMNDLNKTNKVIALDVSQLTVDVNKYLKENQYDLKKIAKDSQKAGVNAIAEGQIIDVRLKKKGDQIGLIRNVTATYEVVVRLRVVNVRTEQEIFHTVKTVTLDQDNTRIAERVNEDQLFIKNPELVEILIKDAFLDFSPQILEALNEVTWEGRIAAIRGDKIYLNVGRISGVQVGDLLRVVESGSELYDPEMGYHLGQISGKAKGTLEIVSYFGQDGAVAIIHSGAGFKESDRVELFQ